MRSSLPALLLLAACASRASTVPDGVREAEARRLESSDALVRALDDPARAAEAATAMGRIQSPAYLPHLARAAAPGHPAGPTALWAIGQLAFGYDWRPAQGEPARAALEPRLTDPDRSIRAQAAIAWGKVGGGPARLAPLLRDGEPAVRVAAARGIFWAWHLHRAKDDGGRDALILALSDDQADVRWNAAYALQALADPATRRAIETALADADAWTRLFAARGLGKLKGSVDALTRAAADPEYVVRVEAVRALGPAAPRAAGADPAHHVRAAYARATGDARMLEDFSADVRREAIAAIARAGRREIALDFIGHLDWRMRAAAAEAIDLLPELKRLLTDPDRRVAQAAVRALARVRGDEALDLLGRLANHGDVGIEWAAAEALAERGDRRGIAALAGRLRGPAGIVLEQVIDSLEKLGGDEAVAALEALAKSHHYPYDAMARRAVWRMTGREVERPAPHALARLARDRDRRLFPRPLTGRWLLELRHEKGMVTMLLDADRAPQHVSNVVRLARARYYDGLEWHRVVSNFVIQGGDPRGDGFGDPGYRALDEITTLPHLRGAVGLSKMAKDTGDSQLYITHVPAPHLDGRYTVFGYVVEGMDVVDRIETGDRILEAHAAPAPE